MWVAVVCKGRNGILVSRERGGWTLYIFWVAQFDVKGTIMCHNVKFAVLFCLRVAQSVERTSQARCWIGGKKGYCRGSES